MCEGAAQMALGAGFSQMASERCLTASSGHTGPPGPWLWAGSFQARRAYTVDVNEDNHRNYNVCAWQMYGVCRGLGNPLHDKARSTLLISMGSLLIKGRLLRNTRSHRLKTYPARACKH